MAINSSVIIALCSQLGMIEGIHPLTSSEWSTLAERMHRIGMQPSDLTDFTSNDYTEILGMTTTEAERMIGLMSRSGSLSFEIAEYETLGIKIITRADSEYPSKLKRRLGKMCPPLFYCSGDLSLFNAPSVGYAGSRSISFEDAEFATNCVKKSLENGYTIVSGGAKGVDTIATGTALSSQGFAIEFLADSMLKRLKNPDVYENVQNGKLLLASFVKPNSGFSVGTAMGRNKFIYAQSEGTVAIKADKNKGGTWAGATENLKNNWCKLLCWNNENYPGNLALIQKGALPIDETWDGAIPAEEVQNHLNVIPYSDTQNEQLSLFD